MWYTAFTPERFSLDRRFSWGNPRVLLRALHHLCQNAILLPKEAQEPQARLVVDGWRISDHYRDADIDRYRFTQPVPDVIMAGRRRQRLQ